MRLCRFAYNGLVSFGPVRNERVVDLRKVLDGTVADMRSLIEAGEPALEKVRDIVADSAWPDVPLHEVQLLAPIPDPRKFLCIGLNYRDHCEEQGVEPPRNPIWFPKFSNAIQRPGGPIELPPCSAKVDYEGELGVILGRRARNIPLEQALDVVFGYTIVHDTSARDIQFSDGQWGRAKSFDTFAPMGPVIVTRDEIPNPNALSLRTWLNGQLVQDSSTSRMIFPVPYLISFLSQNFTFEPGDVISTGTPHGVGVYRKPPLFLRTGDTVRIEIERIGVLENPVIGP